VTVPSITVPLPGTSGVTDTASPSLDVEICLGPIQLGTC